MKKGVLILSFFFFISSYSQIEVGTTAPDFKFWLLDGTKVTNKTTINKVVVLKFWFTTCVPCISGIPELNKLVEKYKDNEDVLFIAPALDNKTVITKFLSYYPFDFSITYNAIDMAKVYNPNGIYPTYVIIDKNGKIAYLDSQYKRNNANDLEELVKELLK